MTPLSSTMRGSVICLHVEGDGPEVTRLKRMGVCGGRRLEIVQSGDPMILQVAGTRIGLSRKLAGAVIVEPLSLTADHPASLADEKSGEA